MYFRDYFKELLKDHQIDFNWNTLGSTCKEHLREHFKEHFMEHFKKHFNQYFTKSLKYDFKEGAISEVLQWAFQGVIHGQLRGGLQEVVKVVLIKALSLNRRVEYQCSKWLKELIKNNTKIIIMTPTHCPPFPFPLRPPHDAILNGKKLTNKKQWVTVKLWGNYWMYHPNNFLKFGLTPSTK